MSIIGGNCDAQPEHAWLAHHDQRQSALHTSQHMSCVLQLLLLSFENMIGRRSARENLGGIIQERMKRETTGRQRFDKHAVTAVSHLFLSIRKERCAWHSLSTPLLKDAPRSNHPYTLEAKH